MDQSLLSSSDASRVAPAHHHLHNDDSTSTSVSQHQQLQQDLLQRAPLDAGVHSEHLRFASVNCRVIGRSREAGGGILPVFRDSVTSDLFFSMGLSRWDCLSPFHGGIDAGETLEQGAARECFEESKGVFASDCTLWRALMCKNLFSQHVGDGIHIVFMGDSTTESRVGLSNKFRATPTWNEGSNEVQSIHFFEAADFFRQARTGQQLINKMKLRPWLAKVLRDIEFWNQPILKQIVENRAVPLLPISALPQMSPAQEQALPYKRSSAPPSLKEQLQLLHRQQIPLGTTRFGDGKKNFFPGSESWLGDGQRFLANSMCLTIFENSHARKDRVTCRIKKQAALDELPDFYLAKFSQDELRRRGFKKRDCFDNIKGRRSCKRVQDNTYLAPEELVLAIGHWKPSRALRGWLRRKNGGGPGGLLPYCDILRRLARAFPTTAVRIDEAWTSSRHYVFKDNCACKNEQCSVPFRDKKTRTEEEQREILEKKRRQRDAALQRKIDAREMQQEKQRQKQQQQQPNLLGGGGGGDGDGAAAAASNDVADAVLRGPMLRAKRRGEVIVSCINSVTAASGLAPCSNQRRARAEDEDNRNNNNTLVKTEDKEENGADGRGNRKKRNNEQWAQEKAERRKNPDDNPPRITAAPRPERTKDEIMQLRQQSKDERAAAPKRTVWHLKWCSADCAHVRETGLRPMSHRDHNGACGIKRVFNHIIFTGDPAARPDEMRRDLDGDLAREYIDETNAAAAAAEAAGREDDAGGVLVGAL